MCYKLYHYYFICIHLYYNIVCKCIATTHPYYFWTQIQSNIVHFKYKLFYYSTVLFKILFHQAISFHIQRSIILILRITNYHPTMVAVNQNLIFLLNKYTIYNFIFFFISLIRYKIKYKKALISLLLLYFIIINL